MQVYETKEIQLGAAGMSGDCDGTDISDYKYALQLAKAKVLEEYQPKPVAGKECGKDADCECACVIYEGQPSQWTPWVDVRIQPLTVTVGDCQYTFGGHMKVRSGIADGVCMCMKTHQHAMAVSRDKNVMVAVAGLERIPAEVMASLEKNIKKLKG